MLQNCVQKAQNMDTLSQPLFDLAFHFLDYKKPQKVNREFAYYGAQQQGMPVPDLGQRMLNQWFANDEMVRTAMIEQLLNRISTKTGEIDRVIAMLKFLIKEYASMLSGNLNKVILVLYLICHVVQRFARIFVLSNTHACCHVIRSPIATFQSQYCFSRLYHDCIEKNALYTVCQCIPFLIL